MEPEKENDSHHTHEKTSHKTLRDHTKAERETIERKRGISMVFINFVIISACNFKIDDVLISCLENRFHFQGKSLAIFLQQAIIVYFQQISVPWPEMMKARTHKYSDPIEIITVFKRAWFCCSFCLFLRFSFSHSSEKFSYNIFFLAIV